MAIKIHWLKKILWLANFFLIANCYASAPTTLNHLHSLNIGNQTNVVLDLSKNTMYKVFTLPSPPRLVIDLPNAKLATSLNRTLFANSCISHLRVGHPTPTTLRIVFDLNKLLTPKVSAETTAQGTERLIVELNSSDSKPTPDTTTDNDAKIVSKPEKTETPNNKPVKTAAAGNKKINQDDDEEADQQKIISLPKQGNRPIVVIIDPGHGGKDPGTSAQVGTKEKDVVLAISLNLYRILSRQPGYKPVLTRSGDYFIPLRGRLAIARRYHGDMFVAIHADAYKDPYATGAAVFALSPHGASSEAARWLAEKENYSELGNISLNDKSDMLRSVLIDLSQTATISSSVQLGSSLLSQLGYIGNLHYRTVEQAPFMVLKSPDIPSVLVETGFLSNPGEQARLRNPYSQVQIARALATGIMQYFQKNPIPGTYLASLQNNRYD